MPRCRSTSSGHNSWRPATLALPNAACTARRISRGVRSDSFSTTLPEGSSGKRRPQSCDSRISRYSERAMRAEPSASGGAIS